MKAVSIRDFLQTFAVHAAIGSGTAPSNPPSHQWGYVMGAGGEVATDANLKQRARDYEGAKWEAYYRRTLRWLGRRVWDCNGMAEGYYKDQTGTSINTKARYNYSGWCSRRSPIKPDAKLTGIPQLPGVAVYSGSSADAIDHVGFLLCKYGAGERDWYVIEAKGADYGVIITRLPAGKWRWWGVMDKYFEYDAPASWRPTGVTLDTPSDKDEGGTPMKFPAYFAHVKGASVNVRTARSATGQIIGVVHDGDTVLALPALDGWCEVAVVIDGKLRTGYMSAQYIKEVA